MKIGFIVFPHYFWRFLKNRVDDFTLFFMSPKQPKAPQFIYVKQTTTIYYDRGLVKAIFPTL